MHAKGYLHDFVDVDMTPRYEDIAMLNVCRCLYLLSLMMANVDPALKYFCCDTQLHASPDSFKSKNQFHDVLKLF